MLNIRKLTATFGRLESQTLELHRGLNVISGGNETGKTTWTEFILAMFYGVDTKARARGDQLPVKTQYQPWSGKPMSGRMEIEVNGRELVLERNSHFAPMSELTMQDASGTAIAGLSAGNCGEALLGVEAAVYRSSGCLRQRRAAVSSDPQLEKRLSSLVASGGEDLSFAEIDGKLKKLQNEIQYNQSGELPGVRAAREESEAALRRCQTLAEQQSLIALRLSAAEAREAELTEISDGITRLEQLRRLNAIKESRSALQQAEEDMSAWEAVCAELPPPHILEELRQEIKGIRSDMQTAVMENVLDQPSFPEPPDCPAFFQLNAEQATEKAQRDAKTVHENLEQKKHSAGKLILSLLPGIMAFLAGLLLILKNRSSDHPDAVGLALAGCGILLVVLSLIFFSRRRAAERTSKQAAYNLLTWYEARTSEEILEKAAAYVSAWALYQKQQVDYQHTVDQQSIRAADLNERTNALIGRIQTMVPNCNTLEQAESYLQEAAFATASLYQSRRQSVMRKAALEHLEAQNLTDAEADETLSRFAQYDPDAIRSELEHCREEIRSLRSEADRISGALEQMGDPYVLHAQIEALSNREKALQNRYDAISLARAALSQADEALRSRFSPLLCKRAAEIFSMLTEGRYDRITLDRTFRVRIHPAGSTLEHPLSNFSGGTIDQLYLALRLAICDLLLPGSPIILDDALVYFDDRRAAIALKTLKDLAQSRQILLFTCQSREKRILNEISVRA